MGSIDLPDRCYDLDVRGNAMAVATAGKHILVYDVTNQPRAYEERIPSQASDEVHQVFPEYDGVCSGEY